MNSCRIALKYPDVRTDGMRCRMPLVHCLLATVAMTLLWPPAIADERPARSGTGSADDFPEFELPPLLPRGSSSESTLPPIDDRDRGVIPERSRDIPRLDARDRTPGAADSAIDLPPVRDDRTPLRDDRTLPLRDPFAPASPRRHVDTPNPALPTETGGVVADGFDWSVQPVTLADLEVGHPWAFEHTKPNLSEAETEDYIRLIRAARDRKTSVGLNLPEDVNLTSAWESAFYRFAEARRQAWNNGTLLLQPARSGLANPFDNAVLSTADRIETPPNLKSYSLTADMRSHPSDFVGRPVVLYGLFTPSVINQLQATRTTGSERSLYKLQRGFLRNLSNTENIALVDAEGFVDYDSQKRAIEAWPVEQRISYPVLVKGWFVKTMGGQPLVYCDVVRVLTPRPYDDYIRDHVRNRRRVSDDEGWIYYETLRQLQMTSSKIQAGIALADQQLRVKTLMGQVHEKVSADRTQLQNELRKGTPGEIDSQNNSNYQARLTRLERQFDQRLNRYRKYQQQPETFPMFVDLFQYPDRWQGHLVTLRGHVRRVTSHEGDPGLFNSQPLYELWLFTDDSQHNPTVIVTPSLPDEFPRNATDVDSVTVTGCLFKMYVYKSQTENRIAPLLLAGRIDWQPTNDQILALGDEGHFSSDSRLLAIAKANSGNPVSDTMVLLFGFVSLLATMTVWGRVQRDRRESERLKSLVDERPDFRQTSQDMYSGPFAESRYEPTRG
jgi:hypothetical protein